MKTLSELGYEVMPFNKLVKADWNYKEEDAEQLKKLKANIKENGQIENIIVREKGDKYEIVNGNHRYDAFKDLGFKNVVVNNLGKISKQNAIKKAIQTNETKFQADQLQLSELFAELLKEFTPEELSKTMPYTTKEIEDWANLKDFDWDQYDGKKPEDKINNKFVITFDDETQKQQFLKLFNAVGDGTSEGTVLINVFKHYLQSQKGEV